MKTFHAYILEHYDDGVWSVAIAVTATPANNLNELNEKMNDKLHDEYVIEMTDDSVTVKLTESNALTKAAMRFDDMAILQFKLNLLTAYFDCMKKTPCGDVWSGGDVELDSEAFNAHCFSFKA